MGVDVRFSALNAASYLGPSFDLKTKAASIDKVQNKTAMPGAEDNIYT